MNATQLIQHFKKNNLRVFTTAGAITLTNSSAAATVKLLGRLAQDKIVLRLKKGVWVNLLSHSFRLEEALPFLTAPWPSYISLYSALSEYGWIAEIPTRIFAISGGRPVRFKTPLGEIDVHHLPPKAMWGFEMRISGEGSFPIAVPEKAYLDTVYLASIPRSPIRMPVFRHRPRFDKTVMKKFLRRWPEVSKHRRLFF